jgi:hypothetical protein
MQGVPPSGKDQDRRVSLFPRLVVVFLIYISRQLSIASCRDNEEAIESGKKKEALMTPVRVFTRNVALAKTAASQALVKILSASTAPT